MNRPLDALFISPDSSAKAYQGLAQTYSAIEPPTWALLLAESCRARGFGVGILDCDAERLTLEAAVSRVEAAAPRLVVMVVYGQNPNSGTTSMIGATALAQALKAARPDLPLCFVGSHVSALPREVLALSCVDIVLCNEGVYALHDLLAGDLGEDLAAVRGIGYKRRGPGGECDKQYDQQRATHSSIVRRSVWAYNCNEHERSVNGQRDILQHSGRVQLRRPAVRDDPPCRLQSGMRLV